MHIFTSESQPRFFTVKIFWNFHIGPSGSNALKKDLKKCLKIIFYCIVMQATHVSTSVSQTEQANQNSQIRYFKLAVDTFFLRMENNLADEAEDYMFKDEDHIIEKADQITEMYNNLSISLKNKSELRQYILKEADTFNSKYEGAYGKTYADNYFDFIDVDDFDDFEAEKNENADQYKVKKPIDVIVTDSDSESESEDEKSMFSETQSEADSDDSDASSSDSESEEEDDDETMYDSEEDEEDISNLDLEEEYRFYRKRTNQLYEENEELKETRRDLGAKIAQLTRENEVKDERIKFLEALREQDNSIINQYIQNTELKNQKHIEELKNLNNELTDAREKALSLFEICKAKDNELEELKNDTCDYDYIHVLDDLNKVKDKEIGKLKNQIRLLKLQIK